MGRHVIVPPFEKRLQERYVTLVQSHVGGGHLASGIHAPPEAASSLAATQAAYRFFHNPKVTLRGLAAPLVQFAAAEVSRVCDRYVLVVHDWSPVSLPKHTRKKDRISLSQRRVPEGYELQAALAVSDRDGLPMAPLSIGLRAADGVHCSRSWKVREPLSPLDELDPAMRHVEGLKLPKPTVHVIDAEADSVAHYRLWSAQPGRLYLVRCDDRLVEHAGVQRKCSVIQQELRSAGQLQFTRDVQYHGRPAKQFVAEVPVRLLRPGQRNRTQGGIDRQRVRGQPLPLRLVISEVRADDGTLLATWLLLTNAPAEVDPATIALWYYWRWSIEEFWKLLKSAGLQLEDWRQDSAGAMARRLLVGCMACALVWRLARSEHPDAAPARRLLVRWSGRQMRRGVEFTLPALLAGLWVLLAMMDALESHEPEELRRLADVALGRPP